MRYAYYPGCSLESSAKEYDMSLRAVFEHLGIELEEIDDWNCCGATPGAATDKVTATALAARNLAWAEERGLEVVVPCSACYKNLHKADKAMKESPELREKVNARLAGSGNGARQVVKGTHVKGPVEVLVVDYGLDKIEVIKKLAGIKVLPYYGCPMTRPKGSYENTERPMALDNIVTVLGAQPLDCAQKTRCCGGGIVINREDIAINLTSKIIGKAVELEADCLITMCPLCHMLLDAYQSKAGKLLGGKPNLPILYFTQLIGLALGIDNDRLGFKRHVISPAPLLEKISKL